MRLVESETAIPADEAVDGEGAPIPPRPEHRRVRVSLIFTLLVLVTTVVAVYVVVPERHNALMEAAVEAHTSDRTFDLATPSARELRAWSLALFGREVPWPEDRPGVDILGARAATVLNREAAVVRFRVDDATITVLVQRPRDAVPQDHRREIGGEVCVSWRRGRFTFVAVGPLATPGWRELFGAPQ